MPEMISDQTVEIAAKAFDAAWGYTPREWSEKELHNLRATIEAVAPRLLQEHQGIPTAALQAAAEAMEQFAVPAARSTEHTWADYAREALNAAAPHMQAPSIGGDAPAAVQAMLKDAYGRGWGAGFRHHKEAQQ